MKPGLDPEAVHSIVTHMNDDHADALLACVRAFTAYRHASDARMTGIDAHGFGVDCTVDGATLAAVVPFDEPLASVTDVRRVLVTMTREARARLDPGDAPGAPHRPADR